MSIQLSDKTVADVRSGTLVEKISDALRQAISAGSFKPGEKLPSESQLTQEYGVSRTVVREAIAALRSDRLVEARRGAGVFVLEPEVVPSLPFQNIDYARISSILEMLELRAPVEIEAAGLAAQRRSPAQEEAIIDLFNRIDDCIKAGQPTAEADFALHIGIADATNNPRFREFLAMMGHKVIPRTLLKPQLADSSATVNLAHIQEEHGSILSAISNGDVEEARGAMRRHLLGSQRRYRQLLRNIS